MKKKVLIDIYDKHDSDGDIVNMEMSTSGTIEGESNDYLISYTEHDGELAGCVTNLRVKDGKCITMTREGSFNTELIIELNKRHNCHYSTPFGDFMMGVFAKRVESDINESGGTLSFEYTIDFNSDYASNNELTINIKELQECQN